MEANKLFRPHRARYCAQAFLNLNKDWLLQLTRQIRIALTGLGKTWGLNGEEFWNDCFLTTALAYGTAQLMESSARRDPKHFDGGASLIHINNDWKQMDPWGSMDPWEYMELWESNEDLDS